MPHELGLITTLASGFGLALIFGFIAAKMGLPALVGYLLAGILIGPSTPGFVADGAIAAQLAEVGVMLLMFGVGLHFSLKDLLAVRRLAVPGAIVQMIVATALGGAMAHWWWSWSPAASLVFGLSLSVASTVVLLKALESRGLLESVNGQIAVGWLVVEDLAMVLVLVLLPPLADAMGSAKPAAVAAATGVSAVQDWWVTLGLTLARVAAFIAIMLVAGRRLFPWLLWQVTRTGSRELFTLAVIATAVGIAFGSAKLFGVSFALGAFFAGMVMRESQFSHRAAEESLPLRDAFAVLFFVSVGMLFEPEVIVKRPLEVLGVVGVIVVGKSIASAVLVLLLRYPLNTAMTVSASLAQIGEFSFILASLGVALGMLPKEGQSLILAGALISIAVNPLAFAVVEPLRGWVLKRSALARKLELRDDPLAELPTSTHHKFLSGQVVLVGYGRVGRRIARDLREHDIPYVVTEQNREVVEQLRDEHIPAVAGNAADEGTLIQAHIARAGMLVIATADTLHVRQMIHIARTLNPDIEIIVRSHNEEEAALLEHEHQARIFLGEHELAQAMARHVLQRAQPAAAAAH